jgi:hypothetical protein
VAPVALAHKEIIIVISRGRLGMVLEKMMIFILNPKVRGRLRKVVASSNLSSGAL